MHPNPAFRKTPREINLEFARARGFGVLTVNGADGPVMAHVPFLLSADGSFADLHLARSNAVIAAGVPAKAVLAVTGPDAYVSPDWYGVADQVPTWNYIAVDLRGELVPMPPETLAPHVNALSDEFEARLAPKPMWKSSKMTDGVMERMLRMILPFRLRITGVDGTWKLNQNKTAEARAGVIAALEAMGERPADLAQLMRDLPDA
ncbi:MAG: FMN-binding negative transcriptional regulator [Cypionkella sp.]